ncbi:MAG: carbon monoxide dehydrogenase accessory protein [Acidimicrobiaceae bacterium]|nr:carbon monoxide dehydrogenase accessory protein [Acidimicrobiaceae bacterium]
MHSSIASRAAELIAQRRRFVQATVVRAQCPTSARPGDAAIVLADGTIEGFVGGQCAEESVRVTALDVLARGGSTLLRILPDGSDSFPEAPGAVTTVNPCLSGGAIEVFLEAKLPAARLVVVGATPIADALVQLGGPLGFAMDTALDGGAVTGATAVLIASHGREEEATIRAALDAEVGFIGLVASATRGAAVIESLGLNDDERKVVHSPVGVDIGARTAEEIALSILADVVRSVRVDGLGPPKDDTEPSLPATAVDPVCGMTVTIGPDTAHLQHDGVDYWFCNPGCRTRHADELGAA